MTDITPIQQIKAIREAFGTVPLVRTFEYGEGGEYLPQPDARISLNGYLTGWRALHAEGYKIVDTLTPEERKAREAEKRRAALKRAEREYREANEAVLDAPAPLPAWGIFAKPLELWMVDRVTEQPEAYDTESQAQDAADALNENARVDMPEGADPEPFEVRRLPSDTDTRPYDCAFGCGRDFDTAEDANEHYDTEHNGEA